MDLAELGTSISTIRDEITQVKGEISSIKATVEKKGLTIRDICEEYLHRSIRWVQDHPWWIPLEPDVPGRPAVYYRWNVEAWLKLSEPERWAQYYKRHQAGRSA